MTEQLDAVVVGSGPNGLAAAITLAARGHSVTVLEASETPGGSARSGELTVPGLVHDLYSATHPFGAASPFFGSLPLAEHGLRWAYPEIDLAHPMHDGTAAVMVRDLDETCRGLGADGPRWRQVFGPLLPGFDELAGDVLGPVLRWPDHPLLMARFGARAALPAAVLAGAFTTPGARALWAGSAAHVFQPLSRPMTSSVGVMLTAACHVHGWPVAIGGSVAISNALVSLLESLGGTVVTGHSVRSRADLPASRVVMLDTAPGAAAEMFGGELPRRTNRAYRRFRHGPAAYKVDLAVRGGVPWAAEEVTRAGFAHVGGSFEEIAHAEREVAAGRMPARPFVLVAQQYLADPSRSVGDVDPIYAYAHVPAGWRGDVESIVIDQIERFAPGLRDRIVASCTMDPGGLATANANNVAGDIAGGANNPMQLLGRPRLSLDPYATGLPGVYLCSASTPPGAGVHGMCGHQSARRAAAWLEAND